MTYQSTKSDYYLWYLILRGKKKENKTKTPPDSKFLPVFNGRNNQIEFSEKSKANYTPICVISLITDLHKQSAISV